ncbi:MlaC/ttg2D family ABC transporter substrate-binding protein [Pseudoalteromonas viridis]|uniref:ABC transporter substrate-binding protein n=1 Tax=Pseudoalteromonas viridis TaxID=339617 RepID=A0ABX7V3X2_9GAMM|nr:ABC transporter substrate-binding protein [Pseudoalteromonas viridis]QTL34501.1 ABC transporter substrate-binding protein [Pseudoalteromonas viridis]
MNKLFVGLFLLLFSSLTLASKAPLALINEVGETLFADIKQINQDGNASPAQMRKLVRAHLMSHIDIRFVSYKLLGKHIKGLTKPQALAFISAVEHYLEVSYASALMQYKGQQVIFEALPAGKESKYATVKAVVRQPSGPDIDIHFKFRRGKEGEWRVYDLVAEGISLLSAKQKEIAVRISQVGLAQVTAELNAKS